MSKYLFRLDDIAPNMNWEAFRKLEELFAQFCVKPLIGVIPDNQDRDLLCYPTCSTPFWQMIRDKQAAGWEVALHGYQHLLDSPSGGFLGLNPKGEFAGHPFELQYDRMKKGLEIFKEHGVETRTFMAPAHSYDLNTLQAMRELNLDRLTDGHSLYPYWDEGILHIPQLVAKPRRFPFGIHTFCLHPNEMSERDLQSVEEFLSSSYTELLSMDQLERVAKGASGQKVIAAAQGFFLRGVRRLRRNH